MRKVVDLAEPAIEELPISAPIKQKLNQIQAELATAYRESFIEMVGVLRRQASALDRIQETLRIVAEHLDIKLDGEAPVALRVASDGEHPDLASAVVVADPIAAGYTLSQSDLSRALGISSADVSLLARAFELDKQEGCAVVVRQGKKQKIINYHRRAIDRFRELVDSPPPRLGAEANGALRRVRKKWRRVPQ